MSNGKNQITQGDIDNLANMELQLKALLEENAKLRAKASKIQDRALTMKVSEKGALSVYGLGRFPVTLYKSQWERFLKFIGTGAVEEFLIENADKLTDKDQAKAKAEEKDQAAA